VYDLCLLYTEGVFKEKKRRSNTTQGITYMQTDNTLNCGNKVFEEFKKTEARFLIKKKEFLDENSVLRFNGTTINRKNGYINVF